MRILFISHFIPHPPTGGASLRNFNIVKELSRDHEVHLVTFTQRDRHPSSARVEESRKFLKPLCKEISIAKIPSDANRLFWYGLLVANIFSPEPYSSWRFRSGAFSRAIKDQLDRYQFDVVHVDTIALAWCRHLLRGLPAVLNHHNIESTLLRRRAESERTLPKKLYIRYQSWKLRRAERAAVRAFDGNVVVSNVDRTELLGIVPEASVHEVPNGTDTDFFKPNPSTKESCSLVFAGSMGWYPNSDAMSLFAQDIWPSIKRACPDVTMNLIGSKPPSDVARVGQRDPQFKVLGFVDDVRPIIEAAAVYVVPIRVGGGTRLKILDAMAMGKAIVSHPIGAEGIRVTDGVDIVLAEKPEDFASRVVELLGDPARRAALSSAARETAVTRYAWDRIIPRLTACYEVVRSVSRRRALLRDPGGPREELD